MSLLVVPSQVIPKNGTCCFLCLALSSYETVCQLNTHTTSSGLVPCCGDCTKVVWSNKMEMGAALFSYENPSKALVKTPVQMLVSVTKTIIKFYADLNVPDF